MEGNDSNRFRRFATIHEGWQNGSPTNVHMFKRHHYKGISIENAEGKIFISNANLPEYMEILNKAYEDFKNFKNRI